MKIISAIVLVMFMGVLGVCGQIRYYSEDGEDWWNCYEDEYYIGEYRIWREDSECQFFCQLGELVDAGILTLQDYFNFFMDRFDGFIEAGPEYLFIN